MAKSTKTKSATKRKGGGQRHLMPTAAQALAAGGKVGEVADELGLSAKTLQRWLRDPRFQAELHSARPELVEGPLGRLRKLLAQVVDRLTALIDSENASVLLGACKCVIETVTKFAELEYLHDDLEGLRRLLAQSAGRAGSMLGMPTDAEPVDGADAGEDLGAPGGNLLEGLEPVEVEPDEPIASSDESVDDSSTPLFGD